MRRLLPVSLIFFSLFGSAYAQSPTLPQSAANDPAQAGRQALYVYLNTIAFRETAARRAVIASIHTRAQAEARSTENSRDHAALARLVAYTDPAESAHDRQHAARWVSCRQGAV